MSKWDNIKSTISDARVVKQGVSKTVNGAKELKSNVKEKGLMRGLGKTAKAHLNRKARKQMRKVAMHLARGFLKFLATPPWGWLVSAILLILIVSMTPHASSGINGTSGDNKITQEQYAALQQQGCAVNTTGSVSGSINLSNSNSDWSLSDVSKFASSPLGSTWKISDDVAASYFLAKNASVATKYNLNDNNIGQVTAAVKAAGVSPAFFYLYSVNEGGGFAGFINHFPSDTGAGAVADATRDAQYLVQYANSVGGTPATGGGEPSSLPTGPAASLLSKMPSGSIGRVYIQATSAATAEIADLSGQTGDWSGKFGKPISDMMSMITALGGDVTAADQISGISALNSACNTGSSVSLQSGGLNLSQARSFMLNDFEDVKITSADFPGAEAGEPDNHDNCTVFSAYFIHKYTSLQTGAGDGKDVVNNLVAKNSQLSVSYTPTVYSIFSIAGNAGGPGINVSSSGHTGVVLGIDKARGVAIIGQAAYGNAFTSVDDISSGVNAQEVKLSIMTKANGWSFTDVSKYVTGMNN